VQSDGRDSTLHRMRLRKEERADTSASEANTKMATIAARLVKVIESNADKLSRELVESVLGSDRTSGMRRRDPAELLQRAKEIFGDLGNWLLNKTEAEIEQRYRQIGEQLAAQGIPLSHWTWSLAMGRQQIWRLLQTEAFPEGAFEVFGQLELVQTLDQFFDRAVYHAVVAYEAAGRKT